MALSSCNSVISHCKLQLSHLGLHNHEQFVSQPSPVVLLCDHFIVEKGYDLYFN